MDFGQYLKLLLDRRELTQRAFAAQIKMDTAYLSRIIRNVPNHLPSAETLENFCAALAATTEERIALYRHARKLPPEILEAFTKSQQSAERLAGYAAKISKMPFREYRENGGTIWLS